MYLITIKQEDKDEGAYFIRDENQEKVLLFFKQQDDAVRYAMQIDSGDKEIAVEEYDDFLLQQVCKVTGYKYTIVTENDIVFPPAELQ